MVIDCPNCSCLLEGDVEPGVKALCPFCEAEFEVGATPIEQLKSYLSIKNADSERSPFLDKNYALPAAFKNFIGWIVQRLRENQRDEILKLCCIFMSPLQAEMMLDAILQFDFRKYIYIQDDAHLELLATWIVSGFGLINRSVFASLIAEHLWTYSVSIRPEYVDTALQKAKELYCDDDISIQEEDLTLVPLSHNPLFEWGVNASLAVRQRLMLALLYSGHNSCNGERRAWIQLDKCTYYSSRMHGVDYGYATKQLLESNIFCKPSPDVWDKLFSKEEYTAFLSELGIPTKKSFSRKRMLTELLNTDGGQAWFEKRMNSRGFVQIHPSLIKYAMDLEQHYRKCALLWEIILSLDLGNNMPISSVIRQNKIMAHSVETYLSGWQIADNFPAWRYHCCADREECAEHQILDGKVFLKSDPIWRYIFPPNSIDCLCWLENVGKRELERIGGADSSAELDFSPKNCSVFDPIETVERLKKMYDFSI